MTYSGISPDVQLRQTRGRAAPPGNTVWFSPQWKDLANLSVAMAPVRDAFTRVTPAPEEAEHCLAVPTGSTWNQLSDWIEGVQRLSQIVDDHS